MQAKRRPKSRVSINRIIEETIRRELELHDDIARLVLWAGSFSRSELVSPSSNVLRSLLSEKGVVEQIVKVDLMATSALIEKEGLSLKQKVFVTNGAAVILYTQCLLLLKDAKNVSKKGMDFHLITVPPGLPRSKSKGRNKSVVAPEVLKCHLWKDDTKKLFKDKKIRIEALDNRLKTPNAHDGFAYNKVIMGVGIYSQYEFDEDNNLRRQLTHVVKWNKPDAPTIRVVDVTNAEKSNQLCNEPEEEIRSVQRNVLRATSKDGRGCPHLRKVTKSVLEAYDDSIIRGFCDLPSRRRRVCLSKSRFMKGKDTVMCLTKVNHEGNPALTTSTDIEAFLAHKIELQYSNYLTRYADKAITKGHPKTKKGKKDTSNAIAKIATRAPRTAYKLRSSKPITEGGGNNSRIYSKLKALCTVKSTPYLSCSLKEWLRDSTKSRYEASICFLSVLKLATEGLLSLTQNGHDISVEIKTTF